ncbi:MAG: aldose 1-epimerase [Piscinibacter sp.]|nr:aldose 1-epimerase [Piscinibacter sp.]
MAAPHEIAWIEAAGQRLGLVPSLGGGVARWDWLGGGAEWPLWRPWDGVGEDRYRLASFAMLPWSNRISRGGFEQHGRWVPMAPNRAGEPYPIHGDGWLQAWTLERPAAGVAELRLASRRHGGSPYEYDALQRFELVDGGLVQSVTVTHRGADALPYGLGLHPWFPRTSRCSVTAHVDGVWLSGSDPIPTRHVTALPPDWDLNLGAPMRAGALIDNGYTGWDGAATIAWPEHGLALQVTMEPLQTPQGPRAPAYCLVFRPPAGTPHGEAFCFEPITQPIDAFHLAGRPGLVDLAAGESLTLRVHWRLRPEPRS